MILSSFSGKTALVTGAASGIGRSLALELCKRGAIVYACDLNEQGLQAVKSQAVNSDKIISQKLDVTDRKSFDQCILKIIGKYHSLDYIFNNAGIVVGGDFNEMTDEQWHKIVDINLWGVIHGTRAAYKVMRQQQSGHIINVASSAGVMPVPLSTAYAATKHAVVGLSTSLREEASSYGVNVSVVIPGIVKTGIFESALNIDDYDYQKNIEAVPIKAISPDRAAQVILDGVRLNKREIIFPLINKILVRCYRWMPGITTRLVSSGINN